MLQPYDPRPHKWIALTMDNKIICACDNITDCMEKAKLVAGDDCWWTYGVVEDYEKEGV